jgi:hypothetical protein
MGQRSAIDELKFTTDGYAMSNPADNDIPGL